jgi:transketolase C-terminal domain/subunit
VTIFTNYGCSGRRGFRPLLAQMRSADCTEHRVINFNAKIPDRAFDLGMAEQELDGPEIAPCAERSVSWCVAMNAFRTFPGLQMS